MDKREQILAAIRAHQAQHGFAPTIRELQMACGLSTTSLVAFHLERLAREGRIERTPGIARGIRVLDPGVRAG